MNTESNTEPVKILSSGWAADRMPYTVTNKYRAITLIELMRSEVELPMTDALPGMRFRNNESVFVRLESMYQESEFMRCPRACVGNALLDAAQADWWYANEKRYEDDDVPDEDIDEDE